MIIQNHEIKKSMTTPTTAASPPQALLHALQKKTPFSSEEAGF
jgi:hypothetical protein